MILFQRLKLFYSILPSFFFFDINLSLKIIFYICNIQAKIYSIHIYVYAYIACMLIYLSIINRLLCTTICQYTLIYAHTHIYTHIGIVIKYFISRNYSFLVIWSVLPAPILSMFIWCCWTTGYNYLGVVDITSVTIINVLNFLRIEIA